MPEVPEGSLTGLLWKGFRGRCPKCGRGFLFRGFLTVVDRCSSCGLDFSGQDAGDASAVFGTFLVGAVAVGVALWMELAYQPAFWVFGAVLVPLIIVGTLLTIRPLKGLSVALQYRYRRVDAPTRPGGV